MHLALLAVACLAGMPAAHAQGLDPRLDEAIRWYTGVAGTVDDARAHALLEQAAADDHPLARMWVARCHSTGRMGYPRDPARSQALATSALPAIRQLAASGDREATFLMGTALDEGLGVTADAVDAAAWYRRAADQGHVLAQHNMGNLHEAGRGVPQSDALAVSWWRRAAAQGDAIPMLRLGTMAEAGRDGPRDLSAARDWYRQAAERGNVQARAALVKLGGG